MALEKENGGAILVFLTRISGPIHVLYLCTMEGGNLLTSDNTSRKFVLHLDVNNTVFVGDSITNSVTPEETLNEYLTEVAWGKVDQTGKWQSNGEIYVKPPDDESISYYKFAKAKFRGQPRNAFKAHVRNFTEERVGSPFRRFYDQMIDALTFPGDIKSGSGIHLPSFRDRKGTPHHNIVPSFYRLLDYLYESKHEFAIVFRTFGGDGYAVLQATKDFLEGRHTNAKNPQEAHACDGHHLNNPRHEVNFTRGEISRSNNQITMKCPEDDLEFSNLWDIYKYFSETNGIKLFVEDYDYWKAQDFHSLAAKPLLIDPTNDSVHHVMFDDNFRPWEAEDSIVNLLMAKGDSFCSVDPAPFQDIFVVKADLYQSICNRNYFIDKIELCEKNYRKFILEGN